MVSSNCLRKQRQRSKREMQRAVFLRSGLRSGMHDDSKRWCNQEIREFLRTIELGVILFNLLFATLVQEWREYLTRTGPSICITCGIKYHTIQHPSCLIIILIAIIQSTMISCNKCKCITILLFFSAVCVTVVTLFKIPWRHYSAKLWSMSYKSIRTLLNSTC